MSEIRNVWHYLHNSASGRADATWVKDLLVFKLPNPDWVERKIAPEAEYGLQIDPRDKRTLVVFDGCIPWGGLPKAGTVNFSFLLERIAVPIASFRKYRLEEEPHFNDSLLLENKDFKEYASIRIKRHFLLLPKSIACVQLFDNKSLRPIFTFIEIKQQKTKKEEVFVTWRTSS